MRVAGKGGEAVRDMRRRTDDGYEVMCVYAAVKAIAQECSSLSLFSIHVLLSFITCQVLVRPASGRSTRLASLGGKNKTFFGPRQWIPLLALYGHRSPYLCIAVGYRGSGDGDKQAETIINHMERLNLFVCIAPQNILYDLKLSTDIMGKIWGFHGGNYEEFRLLGCYAVWLL
jgi:hypothetical protein